ncbi:MAG TPA: cyclic nucleotide-binding domain-containing protein, partial [Vicinamibacteria bacterium]|nr:cyclic nucleotide-binding domain-containing protein [Vicinamibacteria bacterium]
LADALYKAGRDQEEVVAVLLDCVDELTRQGFPARAVALLKKVERLRRSHIEEVNLAPMLKLDAGEDEAPEAEPPARPADSPQEHFEDWLLGLAGQAAAHRRPQPAPDAPADGSGAPAGSLGGLRASPLLESLDDEALTALVEAFALVRCAPGHVILTEGEPGQSVFVLASGAVRVFVRDAGGRNVEVARLEEGAFFGEMAALSGRPRSATVTAAGPCELLQLDRDTLDRLCAAYPRLRRTLEEFSAARAGSPEAAAVRARPLGPAPR